ncbi:hypothetical protein FRB94_001885 [Tulasnella sp. JGI-2019a]|nr:hypothetical protein FRB94_001885 [Tulasnella sp. JGI-2019a]KAG9020429.1 hypothetical protein FRB95_004231 [Tulasnella sp. JGI-2019a]
MTNIDQRIVAGVNLDGTFFPIQNGSDVSPHTPFLVFAAEGHNRTTDPTFAGWFETSAARPAERFMATVEGAKHLTFTDYPVLPNALGFPKSILPAAEVAELGTIDGRRISEILQAYLNAWFDLVLKGEAAGAEMLLKHGGEMYPEVGLAQVQGTA